MSPLEGPPERPADEPSEGAPNPPASPEAIRAMERINDQLAHVWMIRTFLKHAPELEGDDELLEVPRVLYDYCLAVGPAWNRRDADEFLKLARKKFSRLKKAGEEFAGWQAEVSDHTNFQMAVLSLRTAVDSIGRLLDGNFSRVTP